MESTAKPVHKHHEAIVSRDDFIAVQRMLDNAKFKNKSVLPELRVVDEGLFKGFVVVNPRWAGFKEGEYFQAAKSAYDDSFNGDTKPSEINITVEAGDFDLRGFEIARTEFFDMHFRPTLTFAKDSFLISNKLRLESLEIIIPLNFS